METLINQLKNKATGQDPAPELLQHQSGDPYYKAVPPEFNLATCDDFINCDEYKMGVAYLIHSEVTPGIYWAKRTKPDFQLHNQFLNFLEKGRVYVFSEPN